MPALSVYGEVFSSASLLLSFLKGIHVVAATAFWHQHVSNNIGIRAPRRSTSSSWIFVSSYSTSSKPVRSYCLGVVAGVDQRVFLNSPVSSDYISMQTLTACGLELNSVCNRIRPRVIIFKWSNCTTHVLLVYVPHLWKQDSGEHSACVYVCMLNPPADSIFLNQKPLCVEKLFLHFDFYNNFASLHCTRP